MNKAANNTACHVFGFVRLGGCVCDCVYYLCLYVVFSNVRVYVQSYFIDHLCGSDRGLNNECGAYDF